MRTVIAFAAVLLVAACAGAGSKQGIRYFVLEARGAPPAHATAAIATTLRVVPTTAAPFYDTGDIVFSRAAGTRGIYQFSRWTEPPGRGLAAMLVARLEQAGAFRATMLATTGGDNGSLVLRTHLVEIYHDATTSPGMARITLTAELADPARGLLLGRRTFTAAAAATAFDADGAVQGLREAVGTLLDQVATWATGMAAP